MKPVLTLCLGVLMLVSVGLAGCGGDAAAPSETNARMGTPAPAPDTAPAPVATPEVVPASAEAPQETAIAQPAAPETAAPAPALPSGGSVTIYRDVWGVPHIYAETEAEAAYGLGYAQAQDRLDDLYVAARTATGQMAEAFGKSYTRQDIMFKLYKNAETCRDYMENQAPDNIRAISASFIAGAQAYIDAHPEEVPEFALPLEWWHPAAIGRAMILRWPVGTIMDDLDHKDEAPPMGSNGWAVSPSRSADNCAIVCTDPHLTWEGLAVFYEARLHGGDWHQNGFFVVGSPMVALGHNQNVGWACTTGGPDTSDVFMVKVDLLKQEYQLNGEWKKAEIGSVTVNVKDGEPKTEMAVYTELGPVVDIDMEKGIAYIGATPYFNEGSLVEQMYRMTMAGDVNEFYDALAMNQFMEQNLIFGDTKGNIRYVRVGRTPIRPEGPNWSAPVPGTPENLWKGLHPVDDLVQVMNPPQGYMQNCNISPLNMMKDSPLTPDKYRDYIYNVSWDKDNPRGMRALELLAADDSLTKEEALAIPMDVFDIRSPFWKTALKAATDSVDMGQYSPETMEAAKAILAWDGRFTHDATATMVYKAWREKAGEVINVPALIAGEALDAAGQKALLDQLQAAVESVKAEHGKWAVAWGDVHVVGRSGRYFPVGGVDFGGGANSDNKTETLRDVGYGKQEDAGGKEVARKGSMTMMVMFMRPEGVESYSCYMWGQSADPDSPHHVDQAMNLYSRRAWKPTWFAKDQVLANLESEETLSIQ